MGSGGGLSIGKVLGAAVGLAAGISSGNPQVGLAAFSAANAAVSKKKPKVADVNPAQASALAADATAAKASRASLFSTDGGINGQELTPDQVLKRDTILGN